ncbi:hypothetical protein [Rubrobacter aplysinae]|uniref:hypothetical protein n=1 Tax=Rubrobacter aplysinae TaxID=909625 RepID=UPI00064BC69A|nr:hypothetical protein [Rubrobacter aplysinae]
MVSGILGLFGRRGAGRLRPEQSLGAFPLKNGDVSPLYVLFTVYNPGPEAAVAERIYLRAGRGAVLDLTGELGGDGSGGSGEENDRGGLPREIPPDGSATLWMRAKELSSRLQDAGCTGTPKLGLVVVDSGGAEHATTFKLRVDEYLRLKDE